MKARGAGALRGAGGALRGTGVGGKAGERSREGGGALSHNSKTISATLGPASAQAIGPDARIKPLNCASQSSPFPGAHGHSYEVERRSRAGGGWGRRESARARPGSSPGEKPWDGMLPRHSLTPRGGPAQPSPCPSSEPRSRPGGPSLPHPGGPTSKSGAVGGQVGLLESSRSLLSRRPEGQTKQSQGP